MVVDNVEDWLARRPEVDGRIAYATIVTEVGRQLDSLALSPENRRIEIGATWVAPSAWSSGANVERSS